MIQQIDDFLTPSDIHPVTELIKVKGYTYGWPSGTNDPFSHWNLTFAGKDPKSRLDVEQFLPDPVLALWQKIKQSYLQNFTVIRAYSNAYTYGTEGYIHTDSTNENDLTVLVYLNTTWDRNWAGETVFFNGDDIVRAVLPKLGRMIIFPATMDHVARSVARSCAVDRQILTFKVRQTDDTFVVPEETKKIAHSNRTLDKHLENTKKLLDGYDIPEYVKVAAGIHSIYGTNSFETSTFNIETDRTKIQSMYGVDAESLAYLFCTINRPIGLEQGLVKNWRTNQVIEVTAQELEYLQLIEAANLIEQRASLESCPEIYKTWAKYLRQKR